MVIIIYQIIEQTHAMKQLIVFFYLSVLLTDKLYIYRDFKLKHSTLLKDNTLKTVQNNIPL